MNTAFFLQTHERPAALKNRRDTAGPGVGRSAVPPFRNGTAFFGIIY